MQKDFVIQEALEEHDKDGDGFVSLEEFLGDYRRDPSKQKGRGMKEGTEQKLLEWGELYAPLFSAFYTSTYRF